MIDLCFYEGSTQELRVALTRSSGRKRLEAETQRACSDYNASADNRLPAKGGPGRPISTEKRALMLRRTRYL